MARQVLASRAARGALPPVSRWGGLPVSRVAGSPDAVLKTLPRFEKVRPEVIGLGPNPSFDMVVARWADRQPIPVGMVSKTYHLVQHETVLNQALDFVRTIPQAEVPATIDAHITPNGERVAFRIDLGENFAIHPDGQDVILQLLCRNSVDGSGAIRAELGWYRLVCSNGLIVGVTLGKTRLVHKPDAKLDEVFEPIRERFEVVRHDMRQMEKWAATRVTADALRGWVDGPLVERWSPLAACRVWHICRSGRDARFVPPFKRTAPSKRAVELSGPVPGAVPAVDNLYGVVQALSWVASRRGEIDEAEARQREIGRLIEPLAK